MKTSLWNNKKLIKLSNSVHPRETAVKVDFFDLFQWFEVAVNAKAKIRLEKWVTVSIKSSKQFFRSDFQINIFFS